ncbi:MAG: hypothetical protein K0Q79_3482 [Flavipsychrobacter sp.]|jgi:hypothetical protein|nr:hypothetical protein [Flavipsychrobacter sp.]
MSTAKIVGILFIGFVAIFSNCKKPDQRRDYVEMDIDSAVKARLNFLPGTYWIYRDSLTGRIDSFYVRSNEYQEQSETYVVYKYHLITIAEVNIDGTAPADSANWVFDYRATKIIANYNYTTFDYGWKNQILFEPLFLYPYSYGDLKGKYDTTALTQIDSFYSVNGLPFYDVAHVYHFSDFGTVSTGVVSRARLTDWFYVNDSVGMIRMKLDHADHNIHHDWCLLRYNIVR